ncbi:MAG: ATP-binding protein [Acidobacteriota bacterium]|nr:ATP-binding protein [Acidobacteriota bacterium]
MGLPNRAKGLLFLIITAGAVVIGFSLHRLSLAQLDWRFLLLAVATITIASRLTISIPRVEGEITFADTLIFLAMLLYDGEAAILLATAEALGSSVRVSKKPRVFLFNAAQMACSTFLTVWVLRLFFGSIPALQKGGYSARFLLSIGVMALVQYGANSGLVALWTACKTQQPVWATWSKYYLWTSLTYLAGASIAGIAVTLVGAVSVYAGVIITPIVVIIYFTYKTYLKNVEASAEKAEQARHHVEELSRYIAEQERIREQFTQIEKMSAVGQLASGVAHDFNNTLAGILGRAELMLRRAKDPETRRGLEIIIQAAGDGAKTVKRIQDFARQRRDHDFVSVAVDQLLMDVNEITRPRWKDRAQSDNVHINLNLQINSASAVMGDPSELREVLINMVFNAVDAMPEGGRLTLAAEERNGSVEISISDTGIGMTHEVRSRIFDPFFTTKGNAGMGLGLAVCYGIIQRHEGVIEVESEVGRGTTFLLRLPIAEAKALPVDELVSTPRLTLVPTSNSPRILVADDESSVRELLGDILESEGFEVTLAENGHEALRLYDTGSFHAVFTDLGMPDMSGWELARAIRERSSGIPLAVITGWGEAVGSTEQEEAKVDWVVTKPFSISRIIEITAEVLRRNGFHETPAYTLAATGTLD